MLGFSADGSRLIAGGKAAAHAAVVQHQPVGLEW